MADDTTTAEPDAATAPDEPTQQQPDLGDAGQKALREERRKAREALKQLGELQGRLKAFEDRDKTELQRLAEAREAAERRATDAEAGLVRFRVAAAKNLPPELADRLRGSTEDELAADADRLLELTGAKRAPDFDGGARTPAGKPTDMNALIRRQAGLG